MVSFEKDPPAALATRRLKHRTILGRTVKRRLDMINDGAHSGSEKGATGVYDPKGGLGRRAFSQDHLEFS